MKFNPKPKPEPKPKRSKKFLVNKKPIRVKPKAERRVMPKSERTLLEAEADRLCSHLVRERDQVCVTCGRKSALTCSHFIKRADQLVRYDVDMNLNCQCLDCNSLHNTDETAYTRYMVGKFGQPAVDRLKKDCASVTYFSWSVPELRDMVKELKELYESKFEKAFEEL